MAHLYFLLEQPEQPTQIIMWDVRTLKIGRATEADLVLDDDEVSRNHAIITQDAGGFEIGDYRTGNGTYLDGNPVDERARFLPGSVIEIGKTRLILQHGETHPATLGHKLVYGSQLKTVGQIPAGADGSATVLGLGPMVSEDMDDFVIEPMRSTGEESFEAGMNANMREFSNTADEMDLLFDEDPAAGGMPSTLELDDSRAPAPVERLSPPTLDLDEILEPVAPRAPTPQAAPPPQAAPSPQPAPIPPAAPDPRSAPVPQAAPAEGGGSTGGDPVDRMRRLKLMLDEGLISDEEFQSTRARILAEI